MSSVRMYVEVGRDAEYYEATADGAPHTSSHAMERFLFLPKRVGAEQS